jgi:hypothetical protein
MKDIFREHLTWIFGDEIKDQEAWGTEQQKTRQMAKIIRFRGKVGKP